MAANLSLSRANVQTADAHHDAVSVVVRRNRVTLRKGARTVAEADVATVVIVERRRWEITLTDGAVWAVQSAPRRCCGRG